MQGNRQMAGVAERLDSGSYQLIIRLGQGRNIRVGALGTFPFPVGGYLYTGRAVRNLFPRLERHCRRRKVLRWHIDYLLQWAEIMSIHIFPGQAHSECAINLETSKKSGYSFLVRGFGSSDCRCPSHLIRIGQ